MVSTAGPLTVDGTGQVVWLQVVVMSRGSAVSRSGSQEVQHDPKPRRKPSQSEDGLGAQDGEPPPSQWLGGFSSSTSQDAIPAVSSTTLDWFLRFLRYAQRSALQ
ncbi:hypothetical protein DHEL01_v204174 [Diaporthe helianthi]|uniref:Uncharacterized protein n=1 Tax=Diaporthe helianthi TaxID=158607 RepID=A0A2P5I4K2_DIAHE|nr:hypothetical protein DHEL01_v204174 [Diaporthe helianthi]